MRSQLPAIAHDLGADERTLRQAIRRGAVRCHRPEARRLELAAGEREYLRTHWGLLSTLTGALRTEPNVALALLHGSAARGDDGVRSDVDLLVAFRRKTPAAAAELALRLERTLGRDVDVACLDRARATAPLLVLLAVEGGRVLVDRDRLWSALRAQRPQLDREAHQRDATNRRQAAESLSRLLAGASDYRHDEARRHCRAS